MTNPISVDYSYLSYLEDVYRMQLARELSRLSKPTVLKDFPAFENEIDAKVKQVQEEAKQKIEGYCKDIMVSILDETRLAETPAVKALLAETPETPLEETLLAEIRLAEAFLTETQLEASKKAKKYLKNLRNARECYLKLYFKNFRREGRQFSQGLKNNLE